LRERPARSKKATLTAEFNAFGVVVSIEHGLHPVVIKDTLGHSKLPKDLHPNRSEAV
jgi:hypothetical protein